MEVEKAFFTDVTSQIAGVLRSRFSIWPSGKSGSVDVSGEVWIMSLDKDPSGDYVIKSIPVGRGSREYTTPAFSSKDTARSILKLIEG